jgi:hypothetical protein
VFVFVFSHSKTWGMRLFTTNVMRASIGIFDDILESLHSNAPGKKESSLKDFVQQVVLTLENLCP